MIPTLVSAKGGKGLTVGFREVSLRRCWALTGGKCSQQVLPIFSSLHRSDTAVSLVQASLKPASVSICTCKLRNEKVVVLPVYPAITLMSSKH